ncbi:caspase family protein [Bosea caraganae]|uniref:caspase family protein n=1 Tax=Bosea caraganae TaxID=2763117 RepID=UPI0015F0140C|nr:caspase family protein [Bosea caraganae]
MKTVVAFWLSAFRAGIVVILGALLCLAGFALPAAAAPDRRVALVIGNGAYTSVTQLPNPLRDAKAVSASLKRLGFEVVEGYDLKMDEMTAVVRDFAQKLDGSKAGLVYYAGHGIAVGDENYLLPVDISLKSEADLDFKAVNVQLILRQMQRDERVNIVILDACRDNPFVAQLAGKSRSVSRGLSSIETQSASGILIAFATDPRAVALDGDKDGNSPFTSALLRHIETPDVSITTVMDRVRADVWESTNKKQKPWTNSSIIGEFKMNPTLKLAAVDPSVQMASQGGAGAAAIGAAGAAAIAAVPAVQGLDRSQIDVKMWESAERGNSTADYRAYLESFPTGQFAVFAKNRLAKLEEPAAAPTGGAANAAGASRLAVATDEALKAEAGNQQTETALKFAAKDRRELLTRLRVSGFKSAASGTFGAAQRKAITEWQKSRSVPPTGFFTASQVQALRLQTEAAYQAVLEAEKPAPKAAAKPQGQRKTRNAAPAQDEYVPTRRYTAREREYVGRDRSYEPDRYQRSQDNSAAAGAIGQFIGGAVLGGFGGGFRRR